MVPAVSAVASSVSLPPRPSTTSLSKDSAWETLTGLPWTVNLSHAESFDTLAIAGGAGKDTLDTSAFTAGTVGVEFTD